ncbi:carboxypeptidase regulatory-like domain-containing protein [Clostridium tarantellae]|uniref:CBM6 domain-containing protein n=1 Tax=Clostridium tarantellae TaxID=39493 RepID=A0A6I1MM38_9CLOT|nr:carboxypeptidase regulatory-like domain-containing protein [Clostridium tarantellae]MPQ43813.1 hypothetical protein [Clostridium tarantellae]
MQIKKDKYNLGKSEEIEITLKDYDKKANIMLDSKIDEINLGASISGIVVDNFNIPIKNAIVKLMNNKLELLVAVRTDKEGKYDINMIPTSDIYTLLVSATGKVLEQSPSFSLMNVENKIINFNLNNDEKSILGAINGILINDNNKTIIGAVISLYKINLNSDELVAITYSDYDGEFIFSELQPGNYEVIISALKYLPLEEVISVESNKISSFKRSLTIDPHLSNGSISGIITDNLNIAMPKADVILYKLDENNKQIPVAFTKTNFSGIYSFVNVPFGSYFIKSNAIQNITMNNILTPSVKITSTKEIDTYNTSTGLLENGSQVDYLTGFVTSLGGINDGAVTLNVTVEESGLYNLAIQYTSADFNRPLRLEVNGKDNGEVYKVPITSGWEIFHTKIFYVLTSLNKGVNVIKFHGDGVNLAPNLSMVTLILNQTESVTLFNTSSSDQTKSKTYNVALGKFVGSVKVNTITNFAEGIGGVIDSSSTLTVDVVDKAVYYLAVKYLATSTNLSFKVYVNNVNNVGNGKVYTVIPTKSMNVSDALTFTLPIVLNANSNTIQFHGDGENNAPYFGEFTLSLPPVTSNLVEGILENGARADTTNRFVRALGGKKDGSSTITVNVSNEGEYTLSIKYVGTDNTLPLKIDINGISNKIIYTFSPTKGLTVNDIKTFTIPLTLNTGNNTLRFYGNGKDTAPNLSSFILTAKDTSSVLKPTTSTIVKDIYFIANGKTGGTAILDKKQNLITGIGGKADGFFTMEISVNIEGEYVLRIAYRNNNRKFKIDVNGQNTGKIYTTIGDFNDSFSTLINLNSGKNTLKFYGDGTELAPDFGDFELNLNFPINSRLSGGIFSGDTKLLPSGVINSIGGFFDNYFQINYFTSHYGKYKMDMVFSSEGGVLLIDINDINTGSVYNIPSAKTATIAYNTIITLEEGDNSIRFYGNGEEFVPDLYSLNIKELLVASSDPTYKISSGILKNGATIHMKTNFVTDIGGKKEGYVTLTIKVNAETYYDLQLEYIAEYGDTNLKLDVNNSATGIVYNLPMTGFMSNSKLEMFIIPKILLKIGENTLKFYGDGRKPTPKLGRIKVVKSIPNSIVPPKGTFFVKDGVLENGAKISTFSKDFVEGIGGDKKDGSVTIYISIDNKGIYNLITEYLVIDDNRNLVIDINGERLNDIYTLPKTSSLKEEYAKTFIITILLNKGKNIIKFHGDGVNYGPILGTININKVPQMQTYNVASGFLENGAEIDTSTGFVKYLGEEQEGKATVEIYNELEGDYYLTIKYLSPVKDSFLKLDVNLINTGTIYKFPKTLGSLANDAKSFSIDINLIRGRNKLKFYRDEYNYTPSLESFVITDKRLTQTYDITLAKLKHAKKCIVKGYICGLGGIKKGTATLEVNVEQEGIYKIAFQYLSSKISKPIKIAINGENKKSLYNLEETIDLDPKNAKIFSIFYNLKLGENIIKFYGSGSLKASPLIGEVTVSLNSNNPIKIYKIFDGILKGDTMLDEKTGLLKGIGGADEGAVVLTVNVASKGSYKLELQYLSISDETTLLIKINNELIKKEFNLPMILSWDLNPVKIFSINVELKAGDNLIEFYGVSNKSGPLLGNVTLIPNEIFSRVLPLNSYDITLGILENGAYIDPVTGFVTNLGGKKKGSVTILFNVEDSGEYYMTLEYLCVKDSYPFVMEINKKDLGQVYLLNKTKDEPLKTDFLINLNRGENEIKFKGAGNAIAPDLSFFTIDKVIVLDEI